MQYASLIEANLEGNNLSSVKLVSADLSNANLINTTWNLFKDWFEDYPEEWGRYVVDTHVYCNASKVKFQNSQLVNANMCGANFSRADFTNANLQGANLDSILDSSVNETLVIEKVSRLHFDIKMRPESDYTHITNLSYANLNGSNLQNASINGTNMRNAKLVNISGMPIFFMLIFWMQK